MWGISSKLEPGSVSVAFDRAMEDDFNTPQALVALSHGFKDLRRLLANSDESRKAVELATELRTLGKVLYLFSDGYATVLDQVLGFRSTRVNKSRLSVDELNTMYEQRQKARAEKDYVQAMRSGIDCFLTT